MTISSTTRTAGPYAGTGIQQVFTFAFKVFANTDMQVILIDPFGTIAIQALTSQYTVSLNSDQNATPGGSITMIIAPPVGYSLTVTSQVPNLQPTDIANVGNFYPRAVTDAFDRSTIQIQQMQVSLGGAVRAPNGEFLATLPPAASRAGNVIAFDSTGQPTIVVPQSGTGTQLAIDLANNANLNKGAALVAGVARVVDSIAALRTLPKTGSTRVQVTGFTTAGSGGGADFYYDPTDTTSADNGATIIVGGDGGRWKMELGKGTYTIQQFGGGESVSDNLAAMNLAKAALPAGTMLSFPKFGAGVYNFPTGSPDFTGLVLNPDPGVVFATIASPGMAAPAIVTTTDFIVSVISGNPSNYLLQIRANYWPGTKNSTKLLWLSEGDVKNEAPTPISPNAQLIFKRFGMGTSDTFSAFTPAGYSASSLYVTPPAGNCDLGCYPIRAGDEISVGMNIGPDNSGEVAAGIIWSTGYAVLRGTPASGNWALTTKYQTFSSTTVTQTPLSTGTPGYNPVQNQLSIRFLSDIRAQILVSGIVMVDFQCTSGYMMMAGFGATSISLVTNVNLTGWYTRKCTVARSPRIRSLGFVGDSLTDGTVHGAWPYWCANALDGAFGLKLAGIENRAISGQTTEQQRLNLIANPFVNASDVVIFLGTNDIQGSNSLAAFQTSYQGILTILQGLGKNIILVIPPLWYTQTQSGGGGGASVRADYGGDIRAAIGRFAADNGLQLVDASQITGVVDAAFLTSTYADSVIRDNVHETAYFNKFLGFEIAKAVATSICPKISTTGQWRTMISTVYAGGFSGTLAYRLNGPDIELRGNVAQAGVIADGTVVATLQEFLRPSRATTAFVFGSSNAQAGCVTIGTDGTLTIKGAAASNTVTFDGVRFTP